MASEREPAPAAFPQRRDGNGAGLGVLTVPQGLSVRDSVFGGLADSRCGALRSASSFSYASRVKEPSSASFNRSGSGNEFGFHRLLRIRPRRVKARPATINPTNTVQ